MPPASPATTPDTPKGLTIEGGVNIWLLLGVMVAVLVSGIWKPGISWDVMGTEVPLQGILAQCIRLFGLLLERRQHVADRRGREAQPSPPGQGGRGDQRQDGSEGRAQDEATGTKSSHAVNME